MWVSTFAVSALASNFERMGKPFNPLLGETYELKRPDFRIVCEQVSITPRLCDSIKNLYRVTHQVVLTKNLVNLIRSLVLTSC